MNKDNYKLLRFSNQKKDKALSVLIQGELEEFVVFESESSSTVRRYRSPYCVNIARSNHHLTQKRKKLKSDIESAIKHSVATIQPSPQQLEQMEILLKDLPEIHYTDQYKWYYVGASLYSWSSGEDSLQLWIDSSKQSSRHAHNAETECRNWWKSLRNEQHLTKEPRTLASLINTHRFTCGIYFWITVSLDCEIAVESDH